MIRAIHVRDGIVQFALDPQAAEVLPFEMGVVPRHRRHDMKMWKAGLGVGVACAACCAVPLLGGAAALAAGSATLAAMGSALLACADEFIALALGLLALAAVGVGLVLYRRRRLGPTPTAASCSGACNAGR